MNYLKHYAEGLDLTESVNRGIREHLITLAKWDMSDPAKLVARPDWKAFAKFLTDAKQYTGLTSIAQIVLEERKSLIYKKRLSSISAEDRARIFQLAQWLDKNAEVLGL